MVQTKKDDVRAAILAAAFAQFSAQGYSVTTIPAIAAAAGISTANVYRYFPSKLAILYTLYEPWLVEQLDRLDAELDAVADPRRRLERLLVALWRELPSATQGFANNVMQALSTSGQGDAYDSRLRLLFQRRVAGWLADALGLSVPQSRLVAGVVLMAFDGFAMNVHVKGGICCNAATARLFAGLLGAAADRGPNRRSRQVGPSA
jgi:AcrR family transcriptional regulator